MINTEAKIILSFHFCWPATKIHSDAVDYLLIPVVQLLYNELGHCAGKLVRVIFKMLTDNVTFCLSCSLLILLFKKPTLKGLFKLPF